MAIDRVKKGTEQSHHELQEPLSFCIKRFMQHEVMTACFYNVSKSY